MNLRWTLLASTALLETAGRAQVPLILYGVTAAAVCHLCDIRRLCFLAA